MVYHIVGHRFFASWAGKILVQKCPAKAPLTLCKCFIYEKKKYSNGRCQKKILFYEMSEPSGFFRTALFLEEIFSGNSRWRLT